MSRAKTFSTRWGVVTTVAGLLLLAVLVLAACGGEPDAAPTKPPEPTEVAAEPATPTAVPTEVPPTPTQKPTQPPPTATPTEEPTPEPVDDSACIGCHTDQETLQAVAVEEEKPEVESEGEG